MSMKSHLGLIGLIGLMMLTAPLGAQDKKSTPDRSPPSAVPRSEGNEPKSKGQKIEEASPRDLPCCPDDIWITSTGAFHLHGATGTAIYRFPPDPLVGGRYHTALTFISGRPVGGRAGWVYKENGWNFWMFFDQKPHPNGKWAVLYSVDGLWFEFYGWAE